MDWHDKAKELYQLYPGRWTKIGKELEKVFHEEFKYDRVRAYFREHPMNETAKVHYDISDKDNVLKVLQNDHTLQELCGVFSCSERVITAVLDDLKDEGYLVKTIGNKIRICRNVLDESNVHKLDWQGNEIIKFGVIGDPHLNSKWQQLTHLRTFYRICKTEGVPVVYNAGDIDEGVNMRQGHEYEVFNHGADEHIQYIVNNYPDDVPTSFITGNHDHSLIKNAGMDIGLAVARQRPDMKYLGKANARIMLTPNCSLDLVHPLDGASYAISYATQKYIDSLNGGEKPNILVIGHHHKAFYLPLYRNIHAFESGTFEAQTPFMKGKRLSAHVGGWIISVHVDKEGSITRCANEFIPFYKVLENDY